MGGPKVEGRSGEGLTCGGKRRGGQRGGRRKVRPKGGTWERVFMRAAWSCGLLTSLAESPNVFTYFSKLVTGSVGTHAEVGFDAKPGARVVSKASIDRRFCSGRGTVVSRRAHGGRAKVG